MHWPSVLLYTCSSFMIIIFNKIVLTAFSFTSVPFIMLMQSLFSVFVLFPHWPYVQSPSEDVIVAALFNVCNIFFGLSSAAALNVAMFTALRRVSILMTMVVQQYLLSSVVRRDVTCSVVVMIFGSMVAAANDMTFSPGGYACVMTHNFLTAAAQVQAKKALSSGSATKSTLLFWTSILTIFASSLSLTQWNPASFKAWDQTAFQLAFLFSVILGFAINYGATWTLERNDALTLAVAGSTKSAIMGILTLTGLFDTTHVFSMWNFVGLQISTFGSFLYVYFKHQSVRTLEKSIVVV